MVSKTLLEKVKVIFLGRSKINNMDVCHGRYLLVKSLEDDERGINEN